MKSMEAEALGELTEEFARSALNKMCEIGQAAELPSNWGSIAVAMIVVRWIMMERIVLKKDVTEEVIALIRELAAP